MVLLNFGRIKIDIPARFVRITFFHQFFNHADKVIHTSRGRLHDVRAFNVQQCAIGKKCVRIKFRKLAHRFVFALRPQKHLVFPAVRIIRQMPDIRYIHHARYVITRIPQIFFQHVFHQIRAQIPDMRKIIDRRPAGVHLYFSRFVRNKFFHRSCQGIIQFHGLLRFFPFYHYTTLCPITQAMRRFFYSETASAMARTVSSTVCPSQSTVMSAYFS